MPLWHASRVPYGKNKKTAPTPARLGKEGNLFTEGMLPALGRQPRAASVRRARGDSARRPLRVSIPRIVVRIDPRVCKPVEQKITRPDYQGKSGGKRRRPVRQPGSTTR